MNPIAKRIIEELEQQGLELTDDLRARIDIIVSSGAAQQAALDVAQLERWRQQVQMMLA